MRFRTLIALFASSVVATPAALKAVNYEDKFDNPPNYNPALPLGSPVTNTAGGALFYNAFGYADLSLLGITTLKAQSLPFNIGSGIATQTMSGDPGFRPINSTVKHTTPKSIYYAYQVYDATGRPAAPVACTLRFTGKKYNASPGVTQDFVFSPKLKIQNPFAQGIFRSDFKEVTNVTISVVPKLQQAVTVIDLDSFSYVAYY